MQRSPHPCGPSPVSVTRASYVLGRAQWQLKMWDPLFKKQEKCDTKSTKVENFFLASMGSPSPPVVVLGFAIQSRTPAGTGTLARHVQTLTHTCTAHQPPRASSCQSPDPGTCPAGVGSSVPPSHRPAVFAHPGNTVGGYYYYYYYCWCCLL